MEQLRAGIVVCPDGTNDSVLPELMWRYIVKYLRSFGLPVYLASKQRMDGAVFTEGEQLRHYSSDVQLDLLKRTVLVVGTNNDDMAYAASPTTKLLLLQSQYAAQPAWTKDTGIHVWRVLYNPKQLQTAVVLAGIRQTLSRM